MAIFVLSYTKSTILLKYLKI